MSRGRGEDWSEETHRRVARALVVFSICCIALGLGLIGIALHYSGEEVLDETGLTGTTSYELEIDREHIDLEFDNDPYDAPLTIHYRLVEVSTGRVVADQTLKVYDAVTGSGVSWAHHHVIDQGRYNLTIVPMEGSSGTYSVHMTGTDLGPDEQSRLTGLNFIAMAVAMAIFFIVFMVIGWRLDAHSDVYTMSVFLCAVSLLVLMMPLMFLE